MESETIKLSNGTEIILNFGNKKGNRFCIKCDGLSPNQAMLIKDYLKLKQMAKDKVVTHPNWPKDISPKDDVLYDGNLGEFTIEPKEVKQ